MDIGFLAVCTLPVALIVALFGSIVYFFVYCRNRKKWSEFQPVSTLPAQVVRVSLPYRASNLCPAVFQTNDGQIRQFDVPEADADWMSKGLMGALTFQGYDYKQFVPSELPLTVLSPDDWVQPVREIRLEKKETRK